MKKLLLLLIVLCVISLTEVFGDVTKTVGPGANYSTLKLAFDAINSGNLEYEDERIILQITGTTSETATAVLLPSGSNGEFFYTDVIIYPISSGLSISGSIVGPLIEIRGAANFTIDGRVNATGSAASLTINNTSLGDQTGTVASTILFSQGANSNYVQYCYIKGCEASSVSGVVFFSTDSQNNGNDNNTIDHNYITSNDTGRPINGIYSAGTSGAENSGNVISNNNFFDHFNLTASSSAIEIRGNSSGWTVSGNSFYETTDFDPTETTTYIAIHIENPGVNYVVTGNYIGGESSSAGGDPFTKLGTSKSNNFYGIYVGTGDTDPENPTAINGNIIKNINWTNYESANWMAIYVNSGVINIGTNNGNTIGSNEGTSSIIVTQGTSNSYVYGININTPYTINCQNNIIGSFTTSTGSSANSVNFYGIFKANIAGPLNISSNIIGSTETTNSINTSSNSTSDPQQLIGIYSQGTGNTTINNNTIANLYNNTNNTGTSVDGCTIGIYSTDGTLIVSGNTIYNLSNSNDNQSTGYVPSVAGISVSGTTQKTITNNTIYNLTNSYNSFGGSIIGIRYGSNTTSSNVVSNNFIHSFNISGGSSTSGNIYGIRIGAGVTTYSNNIISLGGNTLTNIYGFYERGALGHNNNIYYNSIYIGGSNSSGSNTSYALYSYSSSNTRNFRNNILVNARSTSGGSNLHYALYLNYATDANLTLDFNDYYTSGTGGVLGRYAAANLTTLPIVTGKDVSSLNLNPSFAEAGGVDAIDYIPSNTSLVAATSTGITTDYDGTTRSTTFPAMGAHEYSVTALYWKWTGATDSDWGTTTNWNYNLLPSSSAIVTIPDGTTYDPVVNTSLSTPATVQDLTINSGGILTIAAGKALSVTGTLDNNGTTASLVIQSDETNGDGKLYNNTADVPASVELALTGGISGNGRRFHYIVPPVETMSFSNTNLTTAGAALGVGSNLGELVSYSEVLAAGNKDAGWNYFDGYAGAAFAVLEKTKGYNIYFITADVMTFTGQLNAASHSYSLSYSTLGWNLIGNPYPCNYDLNGISELSASDNVNNTIYFNNDGGYAYYNLLTGGTTGYSAIIPPMQGFFIKLIGSYSTLNLPASSKTPSTAAPLRSKGSASLISKLKLVLNQNDLKDETIVCLIDKATNDFDGDFDAYKFFSSSTTAPTIYSVLNTTKYAINSVPSEISTTSTIPLTLIIKTPGTYKIDITEFENLEGLDVILRHGAAETILTRDVSYSFTTAAGTYTNFEIVFKNMTVGSEELVSEEHKVWYNDNYVYMACPSDMATEKGRVIIYDYNGKILVDRNNINIVPEQTLQLPVNLPNGFYLVNIIVNNIQHKSKIIVTR